MPNEKVIRAKAKLKIANSIRLDPSNPIPIQYGGNSFSIVQNKLYIPFINRSDNFASLLLEARLTSPTQNACITSVASSVVGKGLTILDKDGNSVAFKNAEPDFVNWMKCVNADLDSLDDVLYSIIDGVLEQGNQFIEMIKGKVGGKPFFKVVLHPMQYCRFAEMEDDETEPTTVLISKLFAKKGYRYKIDDAEEVPLYDPNPLKAKTSWQEDKNGFLHSMLHFKNRVKGMDYYGLPASVSGLRFQVLEGRSAQYNIDNLENNMVLGGMLILKSAMTDEEAQLQAEKIMQSHIGAGKTGRIAVVSSETGIDDVKFEQYKTNAEGSYIELNKEIEKKIIACNDWHNALLGMQEGSSLGNGSGFIRSIWDTKEASLLNPMRRKLTDKIVMQIAKVYADVFGKKEVGNYNFWFNSSMPFSMLGDIKPEFFMQVNEARDLAGLPSDDNMKGKYLAEMNIRQTNTTQDPKEEPKL